jgi:hypothetical protein
VWIIEAWALNESLPDQAVKLTVKVAEEPGPNEKAHWKGRVSGFYKTTYGQWADKMGVTWRYDNRQG